MMNIRFGVRKSKLAGIQLDEFIAHLKTMKMDIEPKIITITTKGDMDQAASIESMGTGIFTKELERALLNGEIDCAVHSLKDVPVSIEKGTKLACFTPRQDPRDCLVARQGVHCENLRGLRIGTGSPRREAFLKEMEGDLETLPLRGNVDTRVRKVDAGDYDAVVLAACGLKRIGYENRIRRYFDPDIFVPAAGQGSLCGQTRAADKELNMALQGTSSSDTECACLAERRVLKELGVGCQTPFGVYAHFEGDAFTITAKLFREDDGRYTCERKVSKRSGYDKATTELIDSMRAEMGI